MLRAVLAALVCSGTVYAVPQQAPAPSDARFEVVSIKRTSNGDVILNPRMQPGGRFVMVNAPIARLIRAAYPGVIPELVGAPEWVDSDQYDVIAQAQGDLSAGQAQSMLRALLADRFALAAHVEPREQDVFALMPARVDGRVPPGMRAATADCVELVERRPASIVGLRPRSNGAPACGLSSDGRVLASGGLTMVQLARNLSPLVGRPVIDRTGLAGYFEFTLEYAARPGNAAGVPAAGDDRPSIFAALQEQLGLRLESQRAPVDVLVIDRIERPSPD